MLCAGTFDARAEGPTQLARGRGGVVASADLDASRAGVAVLRAGGNAVDAAIATAYALAVVEPFSAGIGGGGFLLYFDAKTKKTTVVDYREFAPKKAHRDMFLVNGKVDPKLSTEGILAVGVPGMVPGLDAAQKKLGKKKLSDVLRPAITLAEEGFLVQPRFHFATSEMTEMLAANVEAARVFLKNGAPHEIGERLKQPELAKTLRELSRSGARLFTHGRVAKAIAAESKRLNGALALEDLQSFKARFREPLSGEYQGHTVLTMPPPSSGGTHLLQMLKMLELDRAARKDEDRRSLSADDTHVMAEIMRRAFADRATFMGDPAFVKIPIAGLLAPEYLKQRYSTIDLLRATPSSQIKAGEPPKESEHTTHLTVIDREGNVATLTQTVNALWGSGVVVPKTGVLLNNEMDDFAAAPGVPNIFGLVGGEANSVQPGKIPLSSMTPTIVLKDGQVRLALGAPGGPTIITTVLQIIVNVVDRGMDAGEAIAAPRVHMQWLPDQVNVEKGFEPASKVVLEKRGFKINERNAWGNASVIEVRADGMRAGYADPRGDGAADAE
jgi:gamma-glutamyltranspeptidase/glutathione hydrolase